MERELFKDGKVYAVSSKYGGGYAKMFHAKPCVAVTCTIDKELNLKTFKNPVQIVNFFYPIEEETNRLRIKLGDECYWAYDISKVYALIDCNDNWIYCLEEVSDYEEGK